MLDRRLLIVTGKGGTGRSAITAAIAIAGGRQGRRVLTLAVDSGVGLAHHLGSEGIGPDPQNIGHVAAARIDPARALDQYLRLRTRLPAAGSAARVFSALADAVPGVRDTLVLGKIVYESTRPHWDLVVVDADPTGRVLSRLRAGATVRRLVSRGPVREEAEWLERVLADPRHTAAVLVATPEDLPVREANEFRDAIDTEPLVAIGEVVANRVLPDPDFTAAQARAATGSARAMATLHLGLHRSQRAPLRALRAHRHLPFLFGLHTPAEVAESLADLVEQP